MSIPINDFYLNPCKVTLKSSFDTCIILFSVREGEKVSKTFTTLWPEGKEFCLWITRQEIVFSPNILELIVRRRPNARVTLNGNIWKCRRQWIANKGIEQTNQYLHGSLVAGLCSNKTLWPSKVLYILFPNLGDYCTRSSKEFYQIGAGNNETGDLVPLNNFSGLRNFFDYFSCVPMSIGTVVKNKTHMMAQWHSDWNWNSFCEQVVTELWNVLFEKSIIPKTVRLQFLFMKYYELDTHLFDFLNLAESIWSKRPKSTLRAAPIQLEQ